MHFEAGFELLTVSDVAVGTQAVGLLVGARLATRWLGVYRSVELFGRLGAHRVARSLVFGGERRMIALVHAISTRTRANCVERALTVWTLMAMRQRVATLCVGFNVAKPDGALRVGGHAWVEVDGVAVDDGQEVAAGFEIVSRHVSPR